MHQNTACNCSGYFVIHSCSRSIFLVNSKFFDIILQNSVSLCCDVAMKQYPIVVSSVSTLCQRKWYEVAILIDAESLSLCTTYTKSGRVYKGEFSCDNSLIDKISIV